MSDEEKVLFKTYQISGYADCNPADGGVGSINDTFGWVGNTGSSDSTTNLPINEK